nr:MAG TPA: hypothetical protein [Caudoviricetes sp.]
MPDLYWDCPLFFPIAAVPRSSTLVPFTAVIILENLPYCQQI